MAPVFGFLFLLFLQVFSISFRSKNSDTNVQNHEGITDFKTLITTKKTAYVDKTLFIKEIMDHNKDEIILITRPPCFGKTLTLSTLDYFLSDQTEAEKLFAGLEIMSPDFEKIRKSHMGKHPVIRLDFSDVREKYYHQSFKALQEVIAKEFLRHRYATVGNNLLTGMYDVIVGKKGDEKKTADSINWLSRWVGAYYNQTKKVVVLIDGYDTPIHSSFMNGYYDEMEDFMRQFLTQTLKLNSNLQTAVLTGVVAVAGEVLPKNVVAYTILDDKFSKSFGFTLSEVTSLIERTNKNNESDRVDAMFNGYNFGNSTILNPKAVTSYLFEGKVRESITSVSRTLLESMVLGYGMYPVLTIQQLLAGENITKEVSKDLDFTANREKNYWSYMLHAGYLTSQNKTGLNVVLRVPNLEIHTEIATALTRQSGLFPLQVPNYKHVIDSFVNGDFTAAKNILDHYLQSAGVFFREPTEDINEYRLLDYVRQILHGVALRYNTSIVQTYHSPPVRDDDTKYLLVEGKWCDGFVLRVNPNNNEGVPVKIWLKNVDMKKVLWKKIKDIFCPFGKNKKIDNAEFVVIYNKGLIMTCVTTHSCNFP